MPQKDIIRLSKLSDETRGTAKVGQELGALNLPIEVLEDTFLRIAIHQKKISRATAEGMYFHLTGVPGFRTTLRKIIGNSPVVTLGHLNELIIADAAAQRQFNVLGIGEKFVDGIKSAPTDIDILLSKEGKVFAIEAKKYSSTTRLPMDRYRADLDTLVSYRAANQQAIPIFTITSKPQDSVYYTRLQHEARKRDIHLLFGNPLEQIEQIVMLEKIL